MTSGNALTAKNRCGQMIAAWLLLVAISAGGVVGAPRGSRLFHPKVWPNALVGKTEAQITHDYGDPEREMSGYAPLGTHQPESLPPGPIRTVIFHPRGVLHPESGTLWVWY